jgi:hypothetical protein
MIRFSRRRKSEAKQRPPENIAERLTGRRPVRREVAELSDHHTVRSWLRELHTAADQQVWVHRPWGAVYAVAYRGWPVAVLMSDNETGWHARPPTTMHTIDLTPTRLNTSYSMLSPRPALRPGRCGRSCYRSHELNRASCGRMSSAAPAESSWLIEAPLAAFA